MKSLFDNVSQRCSRLTTQAYSTSFSFGIRSLAPRLRQPIYSIYGFVRCADEIVDSFHGYNQEQLLNEFELDCQQAIIQGISLNPILNSFQEVVNTYDIRQEYIDAFMHSMRMDLNPDATYDQSEYEAYILGSAEVVGLMCLQVFVEGDDKLFDELRPFAQSLGAAFQKVNFLRDVDHDYESLGRTYFPGVDLSDFTREDKRQIEADIDADFKSALQGIKKLPSGARGGVYLAYVYYYSLFRKIKSLPPSAILKQRIRIPNSDKLALMLQSMFKNQFNLIS